MGSDSYDAESGQWRGIEKMRKLRESIASGEALGPRILAIGSSKVRSAKAGRRPGALGFYQPGNPEEARELVRQLHSRGADFIKTDNSLSRDVFLAMADEANRKGIYLAGHVPDDLSVQEASDAGMRSVEHARVIPFDCAPGSARNRSRAVKEFDESRSAELFARMKANPTCYVPTHLTRKMEARAHDASYRNDPRLKYIKASQRARWMKDSDNYARLRARRQEMVDFYHHGLKLTGMAHRSGVRILAGTDANDTYVFPGFSMHAELAELTQAGLTPLVALQAATIEAAKHFDKQASHGSVEAGKVADLVLLNADPLADIRHTKKIEAVIFNGKLMGRKGLDGLLAAAEQIARDSWAPHNHPKSQIAFWDAVIVGDVAAARAATSNGADVNLLDDRRQIAGGSGRRALNYAAGRNDTQMLEALLELGAKVQSANLTGFTPLHHAAETDSAEAAAFLISRGASLTQKNKRGRTPLEIAEVLRRKETANVIRAAMKAIPD